MDPKIEILLKEYESLRREEFLHKQSLRRTHILIITAISTFVGTLKLGETSLAISSILFPPVLLIILSYGLHDLFSIFVIARHVKSVEKRINRLAEKDLLSWESKTCDMIMGRAVAKLGGGLAARFFHPYALADGLVAIFGMPAFTFSVYSAYSMIGSGTSAGVSLGGIHLTRVHLAGIYVGVIAVASLALLVATIWTVWIIRTGGLLERAISAQFDELRDNGESPNRN